VKLKKSFLNDRLNLPNRFFVNIFFKNIFVKSFSVRDEPKNSIFESTLLKLFIKKESKIGIFSTKLIEFLTQDAKFESRKSACLPKITLSEVKHTDFVH